MHKPCFLKLTTGTRLLLAGYLSLLFLSMGANNASAADRRVFWQGREQFAAVELQDQQASANEHPAALSAEQLRSAFGPLQVRTADSAKPVALFTDNELKTLVEQLQHGLSLAGPKEDVTFAVIGLHPVLGFLKETRVTTGRVFVSGKMLQVVFGQVQEVVKDNEDRRLKPFVPGTRSAPSPPPDWRITATTGDVARHGNRQDWLQFPLDALERVTVTPPPPSPEPVETVQTPPPLSHGAVPPVRSIEERLTVLEGLKKKGLISTEEYQAKRKEILDGL